MNIDSRKKLAGTIALSVSVLAALFAFIFQRLSEYPAQPASLPPSSVPSGEELTEADHSPPVAERISRQERLEEVVSDSNRLIEFYGKVVDPDDSAISGALVHLEARGYETKDGLVEHVQSIELLSDESGLFEVTDVYGYMLTVVGITKDGLKLASGQRKNYPSSRADFSIKTSRENPKNYVLIGVDSAADSAVFKYRLAPKWDGSRLSLGFSDGVDSKQPNIIITPVRTEPIDGKISWMLSIEMIKGGIIEAEPYSASIAPAAGYLRDWSIGYGPEDQPYRSVVDADLYFKLDEGRYGRISVLAYADRRRIGSDSIYLDIVLNESGSRVIDLP